ncbi:MAG: rRNA ((1498)-N(3))-methyltransferase [Gammaproteobacteria bacterium]|jgi:16S rRNA (uracil1498-N3)-methyltransferase|nr:rRNA ((1498)-N(3))-methyltransferase [Gammaproteobacteria bacterium]
MRLPRIYFNKPLNLNVPTILGADESGHLLRVLRFNINDQLKIFDGKGHEHLAKIVGIHKKQAVIIALAPLESLPESPLWVHLGQSVSRGDKMDYSLQKSVELGVQKITPLLTERAGVKLFGDRIEKKIAHWEKVIISACEQCGRSYLPTLMPLQSLSEWLIGCDEQMRLVLAPTAEGRLNNINFNDERIALLIGPESGLSDQEIYLAQQSSFFPIQLGPRILRTETAGPTAIAALQCLWGDLR